MRIVNAMFGRGRGGLEQVFLDYGEALLAAGHEVVALIHPDAAIRPVLEQTTRCVSCDRQTGTPGIPWQTLRLRSWLKYAGAGRDAGAWQPGDQPSSSYRATPLIGVAANYSVKGGGLDAILCPTEDLARHCRERGFERRPNQCRTACGCRTGRTSRPIATGTIRRSADRNGPLC